MKYLFNRDRSNAFLGLAEIARLIDVGELEVVIDSDFPLDRAVDSHRRIEQRHARGKSILP